MLDLIRDALKSDRAIIGYRESIRFIKAGSPKLIIIAKNLPEKTKSEIEHNAKISGVKVEVFDGTSKELGMACGKNFPIMILTIK